MTIRPASERDLDAIVDLSLRAWEPVFASMRSVLGDGLFDRFWPDWPTDQESAVRTAVDDHETWVSLTGDRVVGFVNVIFDETARAGEIHMIAVDPEHQRSGFATALTDHAVDEMRRRGLTLATISTGGDPGHAAARRTYERAGFVAFPQMLYARLIEPSAE